MDHWHINTNSALVFRSRKAVMTSAIAYEALFHGWLLLHNLRLKIELFSQRGRSAGGSNSFNIPEHMLGTRTIGLVFSAVASESEARTAEWNPQPFYCTKQNMQRHKAFFLG
jgi:hypothetical protein